jgi:hypothetical protein
MASPYPTTKIIIFIIYLEERFENIFIVLRNDFNPIVLNVLSITFEIRLHKSTLKKRNKYI